MTKTSAQAHDLEAAIIDDEVVLVPKGSLDPEPEQDDEEVFDIVGPETAEGEVDEYALDCLLPGCKYVAVDADDLSEHYDEAHPEEVSSGNEPDDDDTDA